MEARARMRSNIAGNRCLIWILLAVCLRGVIAGTSQCPDLTAPENGDVHVSGVNVGDTAGYTCDTGYTLSGTNFRVCEIPFVWSDVAPTCNIVDCGTPTDPVGGAASFTNTTYLSTLNYSCDTGYTLTAGQISATCRKDGDWDNSPPTCTIDDCLGLTDITDGSVSAPVTTFGATATYTCITGYHVTAGSQNRTCQAGGSWDGTEPTCSIQDCNSLATPSGGSVAVTTTTYGSTATYSCDVGYDLNGAATITCQADGTWEISPTCDIKDCGNLTSPTDGAVNFTSTTYNSVVIFTCNTGYTLVGDSTAVCTDTSVWNASAPVCNIVDCGTLEQPTDGNVNFDPGTVYQKTAAYTCDTGYELIGDHFRRCEASGQWSSSPPTCSQFDCGSPTPPTDGTVTLMSGLTTYGQQARYDCDTGYSVNGSSLTTCGEGTWSGSLPECDDINECTAGTDNCNVNAACANTDGRFTCTCNPGYSGDGLTCEDCGTLSDPADGTVNQTGTTLGSTAVYVCDTGYEQTGGNLTRTCEADGTWSGSELVCTIEDCGSLSSPAGGTVNYAASTYLQTATYSCSTGYQQTGGDISRTCQAGGTWDGTEIVCEIYTCTNLTDPTDGSVTATGNSFGDTGTFSCDPGYDLVGNALLTCGTGTWDSAEPTCTIKDCGSLSNPTDGTVNETGTTYLETATYNCNIGYEQTGGDLTRTCEADGTWSGSELVCTIEDCGSLSSPAGGTVNYAASTYLQSATYSCSTGYQQTGGDISRTCQAGGTWDGTEIVCEIYTCANLTDPADGSVTATGNSFGDTGTFSCDPGYDLIGNALLTCGTGTWDSAEPTCTKKDCGSLSNPADGTVNETGTTYLETATYNCNIGYEQTGGDLTRTCEADGTWSGSELVCTIEDCGSLSSPAGGTVNYAASTYLQTATYSCSTGYQQTGGDISRTCQAGGTWDGTEIVCEIYKAEEYSCDPVDEVDRAEIMEITYHGTPTCTMDAHYQCSWDYAIHSSLVQYILGLQESAMHVFDVCADRSCKHTFYLLVEASVLGSELMAHHYLEYHGMGGKHASIACASLTNPADGSVTATGNSFGDTGTFSCDPGYDLIGNALLTCGTGTWDSTEPSCNKKDCGSLSNPADGTVNVTGTTYLETATYNCNIGYEQTGGDLTRTCEADGTWSGSELVCTIEDCGSLSSPAGGTVNYASSTYLETATYSCSTGYQQTGGNISRTCQAGGTWDRTEIVCEIYTCTNLTDPTDGSVTATGNSFGDTGTFSCDPGYDLIGNALLTCGTGTWDSAEPTCTKKDCGALSTVLTNGTATQNDTKYLDTTVYTCNVGYMIEIGTVDLNVTCQADGNWDSSVPTCVLTDCGDLSEPNDGQVNTQPGTLYQQLASYTCNQGYDLVGANVRECQADGLWDGTAPTCQIIDCGNLTSPNNGFVDTSAGTTFFKVASYSCDTGYELTGNTDRTCQLNGTWSGTHPTCSRKNCGSLSTVISNGNATQTGTLYEDTTEYTCNTGYYISTGIVTMTVTCTAAGSWDGTVAICIPVDCGDLTAPSGGQIDYPDTNYNTRASYTCNIGHDLNGTNVRTCGADGNWDGSEPFCQIKDCGPLNNITDGNVAAPVTTYGQTAVYTCGTGYYIATGSETRDCKENGQWNGTEPTCAIYDCQSLTSGPFDTVSFTTTTYSSTAVYTCNTGYYRTAGDLTRTCGDGTWNGTAPTCAIRDCGNLGNPAGGTVTVTMTTYNEVALYTCDTGYYNSGGDLTRTCQADGTWNGTELQCTIYDCGAPSSGVLSTVSYTSTTYGSDAVYSCNTGYYTTDRETSVCGNGMWAGSVPTCTIHDCGSLSPTVNQGSVNISGSTYLETAVYACNTGYLISSSSSNTVTLTCAADGRWDAAVPTCDPVDCGSLVEPLNGAVGTSAGTGYLDVAAYTCNRGYRLAGNNTRTCQADGSWSDSAPVCIIYDCGSPPPLLNGSVSVTVTTFTATAVFTCDTGHYLSAGSEARTCEHGGSWNGTHPTCTLYDCGPLSDLDNGDVSVSGQTFGKTATYTCNTGYYRTAGDSTRTCSTGTWSGDKPTCSIRDCGQLLNPRNGQVFLNGGTTYLQVANYTCNTGFRMSSGDMLRTCEADGNWNGTKLICVNYDCGSLRDIGNGNVTVTGTTYSETATYTCDRGYYISAGDRSRTCMEGYWSGAVPVCTIYDCGSAGTFNNGRVEATGTQYNDTATYTCNTGYLINGTLSASETLSCLDDGEWSSQFPTCFYVDCGVLQHPGNGTVDVSDGTGLDKKAAYTCDTGYDLIGINVRVCQPSGLWDGSEPLCNIKDCRGLSNPDNGEVTVTGTTYDETATYTCNVGYYISSGDARRTCRSSGVWDGTQPVCSRSIESTPDPVSGDEREMVCGHRNEDLVFGIAVSSMTRETDFLEMKNLVNNAILRSDINSGDMRVGVFVFSEQIDQVIHLKDYNSSSKLVQAVDAIPYRASSGPSQLRAGLTQISVMFDTVFGDRLAVPNYVFLLLDDNVNMTDSQPVAGRIRDAGIHVDIMSIGFTDTSELDNIAYKQQGHVFPIQSFDVLQLYVKHVMWKDSTCDCGTIASPVNGNVSMTGTFYLDTATFSCNEGYNLTGSRLFKCQYGGSWSGTPPTCSRTTAGPRTSTAAPDTAFCGYMNGDVVIAVGISRTVDQSDFDAMKSLVQTVIDHSDIDGGSTRLGLFVFDTSVRQNTITSLNDFNTRSDLLQAVDDIDYSPSAGSSELSSALQQVQAMSSDRRQGVALFAYLILDDDVSYTGALQLADQVRDMGIVLIFAAVGFTNIDTLQSLAFAPSPAYVWQIPNFPTLRFASSQILFKDDDCNCGSPSKPSQGSVVATGTYFLDVATFSCDVGYDLVGSQELVCEYGGSWNGSSPTCSPRATVASTPPPTIPPELDTTCGIHNLDVIYGIGVSDQMTTEEYSSLKNFVFTTIHRADIDFGSTRFGFFLFDTSVRAESVIHLRQYSSRADLILAIDSIPFQPAASPVQLSVGLVLILNMFSPLNGDRPGISNMAVIASDTNIDISNSTIPASHLKNNNIALGFLTVGFDRVVELEMLAFSPTSVFYVDSYGFLDWSATNIVFKDEICSCGKLDNPAFGSVVETGSHFLDIASFSCIEGYELVGSQQLVCQYSHAWSGTPPTCSPTGVISPPKYTLNPKSDCGLVDADVVVGIATSAETSETDFRNLISIVKTFASLSDIDSGSTRFGFFIFDASVDQSNVISLGEFGSSVDLLAAIDRIPYTLFRSMTRLSTGLQQVLSMFSARIGGNRAAVPDHAFILTAADVLYYDVFFLANQIKESGIMLHIITEGYNPVLSSLAYPADGHFIELQALDMESFTARGLFRNTNCNCGFPRTTVHSLVNFTDTFYLAVANYSCDRGYDLFGSRHIVCQDNGTWSGSPPTCIPTSTTPKPTEDPFTDITCGFQNVDVIFGLAISRSVSLSDFQYMKMFLAGVVKHADIDGGTARLGSFLFDTSVRADSVINLNDFTSRSDQITAINNIQYSPSVSQSVLTVGLQQVLDMFLSPNGRRVGVPAMVFIVTDTNIVLDGLPLSNQLRNAGVGLSFLTVDFNPLDLRNVTEYSSEQNYNLDLPSFLALGMSTSMGMVFKDGECDCGVLLSPNNGSVTYEETVGGLSTYYLDAANFTCNQGFELVGAQQLVCQYGGTWNGLPPICKPTGITSIVTSTSPTTPKMPDADTSCGFQNLDVIIGVAMSRNISEVDFEHIKIFIKTAIDSTDIDMGSTQMGFFLYGNGFAMQSFALNRYKTRSELHTAIDSIQYIQSANQVSLSFGLLKAQNMFLSATNRAGTPDFLYMIIDNDVDLVGASDITGQIKAARVHLDFVAVGFTDLTEILSLSHVLDFTSYKDLGANVSAGDFYRSTKCNCGNLTSPSNGQVVFVDTYFLDVATFSCTQGYDLVGSQQLVCQYGGTWNDLPPTCTPKGITSIVTSTSPTTPKMPDADTSCGFQNLDVIIGVAMSRSISEVDFEHIKIFIKTAIDSADINMGSTQMGFFLYGNGFAMQSFALNRYKTRSELHTAIDSIQYIQSANQVSLSFGLLKAQNMFLSSANRARTPDFLYMIIDSNVDLAGASDIADQIKAARVHLDFIAVGFTDLTEILSLSHVLDFASYKDLGANVSAGDFYRSTKCNCGNLTSPSNGQVVFVDTYFLDVATFSCNQGYDLVGSQQLVCQYGGTWNDLPPTCTPKASVKMVDLLISLNMTAGPSVDLTNNDTYSLYKDEVRLALLKHYAALKKDNVLLDVVIKSLSLGSLLVNYTVVLQNTETSAQDFAQSTVDLAKGASVEILNETIAVTDMSIGESRVNLVTVTEETISCTTFLAANGPCDPGYICQLEGTVPSCVPDPETDCGFPGSLLNGMVLTVDGTLYSANATYMCNLGYTLEGSNTQTCEPSGLWIPESPRCLLVVCEDLPSPVNGMINVPRVATYGQTATFSCHHGYTLQGQSEILCTEDNMWNGVVPTCQINDMYCGGLLDPQHGSVLTSDLSRLNSTATYRCNTGYNMIGPGSRKCSEHMIWEPEQDTECIIQDCGILRNPLNGNVDQSSGTTYGQTVTFSCSVGYQIFGAEQATCMADGSWSTASPVCQITNCGGLPNPDNGLVSASQTTFGQAASYTCNLGYTMSGTSSRICQPDGFWSGREPSCLPRDCGQLFDPVNGFVNISMGTTFGSLATYSCNEGYSLEGPGTTQCESTGTWNPPVIPTCVVIDCGILVGPQHGSLALSQGTRFESVATYRCDTGYELDGPSTRECLSTGTWSDLQSQTTCSSVDCGELQGPVSGVITYTAGTSLGSQAIFDCDQGFYMTGSNISVCSEGSWTQSVPICSLQDCGPISQLDDGSMTLTNGTVFNSIAEFTCNTGYKLSGPESRTCSSSGKWEPNQTTRCSLQDCGGLSSPDNGLVSASQTTFGQVATYTCNEGYSLSGTSSRICQPDGSWSSSPPICLVKDCGSLPDPVFGRVEYSSTLYGSVAVYSCDVGYILEGVSDRSCGADGRWSGTTPTCTIIDCGTLSSVEFGSYTPPQRNLYGTTVTISCDTGYQLNGNATVTCLQTGHWSLLPSCKIRDCGDLIRPDSGMLSLPGGTTYGQTALFSCQTGYLPSGPTQLLCLETGTWSDSPPTCQLADCGLLGDPVNGGVTISGTKFGDYATYICDAGHQVTGSPSRLCQEGGKWSGSPPACIVRDCGQLNAPASGNVSMPSGTTYGNIAKFLCNKLYELIGLSTLVCRADGTWSAQPPICTLKGGLLSKELIVRLNLTAPEGLSLSNPVTYNAYLMEVKTALTQHYGAAMKDGIVDIIINSLKFGSLVVDFTVVLRDNKEAVKNFTEASLSLAKGTTLEVFNENLAVNRMTTDNSLVDLVLLSAEELACRLFLEMSGPCQTGYVCTLVGNSPQCSLRRVIKIACANNLDPDQTLSNSATDCGIPATPFNGAIDYSRGTLLGDTVIYTCNSGYTLVGDNTRTCQGDGNWAPAMPTCSLTDCGTLSDLLNGLVVFGGTVIGQTAFYSCNPGYSLIGASVVTCQLDGTWTNPPPTCRITGCGDLPSPLHGTVTVSADGGTAQYMCQTGFSLTGNSLRTCLTSKLWSGSAPICQAIECFNLPDPLNGRVDITGTSYGSTATYRCTRVGYELSGPDTRTCSRDGQWSGYAPSCDIIECDDLPQVPNGNIVMSGRTYGQTVSYTCNQGFILQGAQTLTCMAYGWSSTPPTCRSSGDCGQLDNPEYGYVTFTLGTAFLSKATYTCYIGYKLSGSTERVCQADNMWSGMPTTCILVDCGQPTSPDGGRVTYASGTTYGTVATYTCNNGYDLIGQSTVTCQNNGTWTYKPVCRAKDCGSLPHPLNGLVDTVTGTMFGSSAVYTCNPGYYLQGASARTCLASGYWNNLVPVCVVRDCGPLATPTHGVVNIPSGTTYGQTATYSCNPGYTLSGTASRQCAVDGSWTGSSPLCVGVVCGSLSNPGNGQVSLSKGYGVGSVARYTCSQGYILSPVSDVHRTCRVNGTWTGTTPVCIFIDCGSLLPPVFGEVVIDHTTFGHSASYTCNQGYVMSGSKERMCNIDGYWSGTQPVCTVTDCGSLNNPDNGKVTMPDGTLFGHTAVYDCNSGYKMNNNYKRTCQSNGTWSGQAPSCQGEFALAVGLGVGLTGFVILVMVIVLIVVILYRRKHSRRYGRKTPRLLTLPQPVPPPLPVKINTGPTMLMPYYTGPAVVDDESVDSGEHTTWRSRKTDYGDPTNPLYYNTTMPRTEYYSFHR